MRLFSFVVLFVFLFGCAKENPNSKIFSKEETRELTKQISKNYYNLASYKIKSVEMVCESSVINYAIEHIKDTEMRQLMGNLEFKVFWDTNTGFSIEINNIPELDDPLSNEKLLDGINAAKNRMLGVFVSISFLFSGLDINFEDEKNVNLIEKGSVKILTLKPSNNTLEKIYLSDSDSIIRSEIYSNRREISKIEYIWNEQSGVKYLEKMKNTMGRRQLHLAIEYQKINKLPFPKVIKSNVSFRGKVLSDTISINKVSLKRTP